MKHLIPVICLSLGLFTLGSCKNDRPSQEVAAPSGKIFNQSYLISIDDSIMEKAEEDMDIEAKLVLSLLSPLKLKAHFKENGYMQFDGDYGLLSFSKADIQADSIPFHYNDKHLYLGEGNDEDSIPYRLLEKGKLAITLDSLHLVLSPL